MSGGVDSSIAAWKLKQDGYDCHGAAMKLSKNDDNLADIEDAQLAAQKLNIPFHVFDFTSEFRIRVVTPFVQTYLEGRTPNPCVVCNRLIKFGKFLDEARKLGIPFIATGHYAQIEYHSESSRYRLKRAMNETKDQSYVLYTLTQAQLAQTLVPLGTLRKEEVRRIAESLGLANAQKQDSQDLCFVPDGDYATFIEQSTGQSCPAGDFVDKTGKVLGKHRGRIRYTIGQRKGLGIAAPAPYYVCEQNIENNTVILGSEDDLLVRTVTVTDINLISFARIEKPLRCVVKVRYRQQGALATVRQMDSDTLEIVFDEPQKGVAQGQAAVLYDGDYVIGGGTMVR